MTPMTSEMARKLHEANAEIERLKAELDLSQNAVCDQIAYAHKLITELCDALSEQIAEGSWQERLVQRARNIK